MNHVGLFSSSLGEGALPPGPACHAQKIHHTGPQGFAVEKQNRHAICLPPQCMTLRACEIGQWLQWRRFVTWIEPNIVLIVHLSRTDTYAKKYLGERAYVAAIGVVDESDCHLVLERLCPRPKLNFKLLPSECH